MLGGMITEDMQGQAMAAANDALNPENITDRTRATIKFLKDAFWVNTCLYQGCGVTTKVMEGGPCWCQTKHFHQRSVLTSENECAGPMGPCSRFKKTVIIVDLCKIPPDSITLGCCNQFFVGGLPDVSKATTPEETDQFQMLNNTFWFYYCICQGIGFQSIEASKEFRGHSKCCCLLEASEPAPPVGLEGLWMDNYRCLCCTMYTSIPPLLTPGLGCCGYTIMSRIPDVDDYGVTAETRIAAADPLADVGKAAAKVADLKDNSGQSSASPPPQLEMSNSFSASQGQ